MQAEEPCLQQWTTRIPGDPSTAFAVSQDNSLQTRSYLRFAVSIHHHTHSRESAKRG